MDIFLHGKYLGNAELMMVIPFIIISMQKKVYYYSNLLKQKRYKSIQISWLNLLNRENRAHNFFFNRTKSERYLKLKSYFNVNTTRLKSLSFVRIFKGKKTEQKNCATVDWFAVIKTRIHTKRGILIFVCTKWVFLMILYRFCQCPNETHATSKSNAMDKF